MTIGEKKTTQKDLGNSRTLSKQDVVKVLHQLKNNYRKAYANLTRDEANSLLEIWENGLQRIEAKYVWQALDYFIYESTEAFPPTIGQFLARANKYKTDHERKCPTIRNAWEVKSYES